MTATTTARAASTMPAHASRSPRRTSAAPVRKPPAAYASRRNCPARISATAAGTTPPSSGPVTAAVSPSHQTARALVARTGSGSAGCRRTDAVRRWWPPSAAPDLLATTASEPLRRVRAEVEVVQRNRLPASRPEAVVRLRVRRHRVDLGLGLLGRLHPDVAVPRDARAGGDQLTDDHILLQPDQRVTTGVDGRVGEHPGGLLEGGR